MTWHLCFFNVFAPVNPVAISAVCQTMEPRSGGSSDAVQKWSLSALKIYGDVEQLFCSLSAVERFRLWQIPQFPRADSFC